MIELKNVYKKYGSKTVLHDLTFNVKNAEVVGFLGPNGAGKTSTMRLISGFNTATAGKVKVLGYDMATDRESAAKYIGYAPEQPPLYNILNVSDYLTFVAQAKGIVKSKIKQHLDKVITACRLKEVSYKEIFKLSKGYRQRLGLAQALLGEPKVLLLDEPTAGLDPGQIQETREVIKSFGKECCVLISTHILPEVTLICQKVIIINDGKILAVDSPSGLQKAADQSSTVFLNVEGDKKIIEKSIMAIDGVIDIKINSNFKDSEIFNVECRIKSVYGLESSIVKAISNNCKIFYLERKLPDLENIFLRYIKDDENEINHN
tara:strand:- start:132 stop:1088 length:957 start_codon:yes stop_codon:yes gene_type:complete